MAYNTVSAKSVNFTKKCKKLIILQELCYWKQFIKNYKLLCFVYPLKYHLSWNFLKEMQKIIFYRKLNIFLGSLGYLYLKNKKSTLISDWPRILKSLNKLKKKKKKLKFYKALKFVFLYNIVSCLKDQFWNFKVIFLQIMNFILGLSICSNFFKTIFIKL